MAGQTWQRSVQGAQLKQPLAAKLVMRGPLPLSLLQEVLTPPSPPPHTHCHCQMLPAECTITPAPADSLAAGTGASSALGRKACKDVTSGGCRGAWGSRPDLGCLRCRWLQIHRVLPWLVHQTYCHPPPVCTTASNLRRIVGSKKQLAPSSVESLGLKDFNAEQQAGAFGWCM